jgi:hypothetical protein
MKYTSKVHFTFSTCLLVFKTVEQTGHYAYISELLYSTITSVLWSDPKIIIGLAMFFDDLFLFSPSLVQTM